MKKEMMFLCVALLSGAVCAEEQLDLEKLEKVKNDTITYTFSVSRDENYDEKAWQGVVESAGQLVEKAIAPENSEVSNNEMAKEAMRAVKETYDCCDGVKGIDSTFSIRFNDRDSDDAPEALPLECNCEDTKGCGGACGGDDDR